MYRCFDNIRNSKLIGKLQLSKIIKSLVEKAKYSTTNTKSYNVPQILTWSLYILVAKRSIYH